ncbi:organelle RRM domain-containing protein 6, chloroplastic [Humulus lupulus]|uniref:organelle RRM domain-containing protein 6, chloroplastic n=1 Tax=Humulus lupulus TaxID=3486 RepID=UPI002B404726|nr:organelle RRM domain-containing protein 6, chloroplastic [Humulus lupulus]
MGAEMVATLTFTGAPSPINSIITITTQKFYLGRSPFSFSCAAQPECSLSRTPFPSLSLNSRHGGFSVSASSSCSSSTNPKASAKLYVSGLSFRTTEESLRNAFENFGQLVEVNLVMDKIAKRPRGFAFLHYETEEESKKAIEGMHGKFLDGRVIFVEFAKPRSELNQGLKQNPRRY